MVFQWLSVAFTDSTHNLFSSSWYLHCIICYSENVYCLPFSTCNLDCILLWSKTCKLLNIVELFQELTVDQCRTLCLTYHRAIDVMNMLITIFVTKNFVVRTAVWCKIWCRNKELKQWKKNSRWDVSKNVHAV